MKIEFFGDDCIICPMRTSSQENYSLNNIKAAKVITGDNFVHAYHQLL